MLRPFEQELIMRLAFFAAGLVVASVSAQAGIEDYCAAYARDIADEISAQSPNWQRRHDNAEQACLFRFTADVEQPVPRPIKRKAKAVVAIKPPPAPEPEPVAVTQADEPVEPAKPAAAKTKPKLKAGSAAWINYCKKKYVSFDAEKGTYKSKTGVVRKCLVTAS
jgi:hypothetical protein